MLTRSIALGVVALLALPLPVLADGYVTLVGIPGFESGDIDMQEYVDSLLRIAIVAAALIAVVKLILAGAQYVLAGLVTSKENAKKDIWAALIGLLIVVLAVTLLRTINPRIVELPALPPPPTIDPPPSPEEPDTIDPTEDVTRVTCDESPCEAEVRECENTPGYIRHEIDSETGQLLCYTDNSTPFPGSNPHDDRLTDEEVEEMVLREGEEIDGYLDFENDQEGREARTNFYRQCREKGSEYRAQVVILSRTEGISRIVCIRGSSE